MPACYWSNNFLVIRYVWLEVALESRWLLMLSDQSRATLMTYADRSVQCCFKSNMPIISNKYENNRKTKPEPGHFWQFVNPGQNISGKKKIKVTLHPSVHCTSAYSLLYWAFQNLTYHCQQPYPPAAQDWLPTEAIRLSLVSTWMGDLLGKLGCCWKRC